MIRVETISTHDHVIRSPQQRICVKRPICWGCFRCCSTRSGQFPPLVHACFRHCWHLQEGLAWLGTTVSLSSSSVESTGYIFSATAEEYRFSNPRWSADQLNHRVSQLSRLRSFVGLLARWQVSDHLLQVLLASGRPWGVTYWVPFHTGTFLGEMTYVDR